MGTVKIGTECCNNCIHWECRSREIEGNPPADVRVYSDYNKCSISGSQTAWRDCCGMFKHIGGVKNTFQADRSSMLTPGEAYLKSVTERVLYVTAQEEVNAQAVEEGAKRIVLTATVKVVFL